MSPQQARAVLGPDGIVGVSAHTVEEARAAQAEGADYLGVGAVFATGTKENTTPVDYDTLKEICAAVNIPVVAIGGVGRDNLGTLAGSGIRGWPWCLPCMPSRTSGQPPAACGSRWRRC